MHFDPEDVRLCVAGAEDAGGSVTTPLVRTSLFAFPSFEGLLDGLSAEHRNHVYSRGQNPTVEVFEGKIAALERLPACKAFASGMAAISSVFLGLLQAGDHVVFVNQIYGPTLQLAEHLERFGIEHDLVPGGDLDDVEKALKPQTRLIWCESPGTMLCRTLDLVALAELARSRGILTGIDNSWATPLLQKPATLGIDLVMHTCSKYIGGHSDVVAGVLAGSEELLEKIFYRAYLLNGGALSPADAWLLLRGLRTLPVRLRQHQEDALSVARFLADHDAVGRVYHPALSGELGSLTGTSGLFSFELKDGDFDATRRLIDGLRHFTIGVSWGGPESLVISPSRRDNAERLRRSGIPPALIRLSIGLEGAETLIDDLEQALGRL